MKTLSLSLILILAALFGSASAARAATTNCAGTLTGPVDGDVIVPNGESCTIGSPYLGANISGNVLVTQNATLVVQARQYPSIISGNLRAVGCASVLLQGAVTVNGTLQIIQCQKESGFVGPGTKIGGTLECQNNLGPCDANLGTVGGSVLILNNHSAVPASVNLTEIHGNLVCLLNTPAPTHAYGPAWVSGSALSQCSGFGPPAAAPNCAALATQLNWPAIAEVTSVLVPTTTTNAAYCNVQLNYSAIGGTAYGYANGQNQSINVGIGLPLNSADGGTGGVQGAWNGRLQHLGGGGCVGTVGATTSATDAGYVGTSTDTGHTTAENAAYCNFGVISAPQTPSNTLNVGKIDDFIIEGIHEQVEWGKLVTRLYYGGKKYAYNYWNGCSTGGRQGLALAQNYGDEFDGLIVGAPAIYWQAFRLSDSWPYLVNQDDLVLAGYPTLTAALWNATTSVVVNACQANNSFASSGAVGYLDDPRACTAGASLNICGAPTAMASPNCLTTQQAAAVDKIWAGPHNGYDNSGNRIWFPNNKGVTGGVVSFTAPQSSTAQVMAWDHADLSYGTNVGWLYDSAKAALLYNPTNGIPYASEALLGATPGVTPGADDVAVDDLVDTVIQNYGVPGPNLDLLKNTGGKMMMWQGTADQLIRWLDSVDFYRLVAVKYGNGRANFSRLQSWFRYYHAPGGFHCAAGTGPGPTNIFGQLVGWVENDNAPDPVPTSGGSVNPNITPPLCPWPSSAIYNGSGATNLASSYHCGGNLDANSFALCQMLRTPYGQEDQNQLDYREAGISPARCPLPQ